MFKNLFLLFLLNISLLTSASVIDAMKLLNLDEKSMNFETISRAQAIYSRSFIDKYDDSKDYETVDKAIFEHERALNAKSVLLKSYFSNLFNQDIKSPYENYSEHLLIEEFYHLVSDVKPPAVELDKDSDKVIKNKNFSFDEKGKKYAQTFNLFKELSLEKKVIFLTLFNVTSSQRPDRNIPVLEALADESLSDKKLKYLKFLVSLNYELKHFNQYSSNIQLEDFTRAIKSMLIVDDKLIMNSIVYIQEYVNTIIDNDIERLRKIDFKFRQSLNNFNMTNEPIMAIFNEYTLFQTFFKGKLELLTKISKALSRGHYFRTSGYEWSYLNLINRSLELKSNFHFKLTQSIFGSSKILNELNFSFDNITDDLFLIAPSNNIEQIVKAMESGENPYEELQKFRKLDCTEHLMGFIKSTRSSFGN